MALRVLISHAIHDAAYAEWLASYLRGAGADVGLDASRMGLGIPVESIEQSLREHDVLVLALTPDAIASPRAMGEMAAALA